MMTASDVQEPMVVTDSGVDGESPFIIWTFRRTGGTSLRSIFFWLSNFDAWQDEAFNRDRELGHITKKFEEDQDISILNQSIADVVGKKKNLKHCIEVVPYEITSSLLRQSASAGYRHVVLLRLNEVERQLSLALAKMTKAWGPSEAAVVYQEIAAGVRHLDAIKLAEVRRELDRDAAALGRLVRLMLTYGVNYKIVFFEDLYHGSFEARVQAVRQLAEHLGLGRANKTDDEAFRSPLMERGQGSKNIYDSIPNIVEVKKYIESLTR